MVNQEYPMIDDRFYCVVIALNDQDEQKAKLEKRLEGLFQGPSDERSAILNEYIQGVLRPLKQYIEDNGITTVRLLESSEEAIGEMTGEQILDLSNQDYISSILVDGDPIFRVC